MSAANGKLEVKLESAEAALTASQSEVAALKGQVEELNTKIEEGSDTKLQSDLSAAQEQLETANKIVGVFDEQVKLAAKMAGLTLAEDASADDKIELLKQAQIKLAAIPRGGVSKESGAPEADDVLVLTAAHNSAFVSNR